MVSGHLFHHRKSSWPTDEYVSRATVQLVSLFFWFSKLLKSSIINTFSSDDTFRSYPFKLDFDGGAPPEHAWRRRLNNHANILKEFSVTFVEAVRMVQ
ncbi:hypothetical protein B296_00037382 [Ensete ventricosum]|uniref:Uncharacterized protein n=1 Tax=Ensete ventricosum TaxID=4639 RepID=A0A426ZPK0_ENSVE|nr:hypothetical protein B296_00037382 [Ensete ventricosum]